MTLVGSGPNVSLTGDTFAADLGLKSDWFTTDTGLGGGRRCGQWRRRRRKASLLATGWTAANGAVDAFGNATSSDRPQAWP